MGDVEGYAYLFGIPLLIVMFLCIVGVLSVLLIGCLVSTVVGKWGVFTKLGVPSWPSLVPLLSDYRLCVGVGAPAWLALVLPAANALLVLGFWFLSDIPVVTGSLLVASSVLTAVMCHYVSRRFARGAGWTVGLVLLGFVFWPVLGFGASEPVPETPQA